LPTGLPVIPIYTVPNYPSSAVLNYPSSAVLGASASTTEAGNKGITTGVRVGFIGGAILGAAAVAVCLVLISKWYQSRQTKYRVNHCTQGVSYFSD
jgi:Na+/H+-translocating membrane pyrophosphatase